MTTKVLATISNRSLRNGLWQFNSLIMSKPNTQCIVNSCMNNLTSHRCYNIPAHCKYSNTFEKLQEYMRGEDLLDKTEKDVVENETVEENPSDILANLNPEQEKTLKILKLEYQMMSEENPQNIPEEMTDSMWVELLKINSIIARSKLYRYYKSIENSKRKKKEEKEMKKESIEETSHQVEREHSFAKNTIFLRILDKTMNKSFSDRLTKSMQFGPHLVFDLGFEKQMKPREIKNTVKQLNMCHGENRWTKDPFHFVFTDTDPKGIFLNSFHTGNHGSGLGNCYTVTDKSYLDLFPKKDLVYLSPHAQRTLKYFNPNSVYIIGALVDKSVQQKVTLGKAKEQGISIVKFPLDLHLSWGIGNKCLTLDQTFKILLRLRETNDWKESLQFVPKRKLAEAEHPRNVGEYPKQRQQNNYKKRQYY
ncbi:hypothetical protein SNE40_014973 [Patella caerulea]|uniref:RNA (guanine-9-)-methyltransferase domain-containing protein 1 n=1 Tax=Patella caerulea TaxID=87958 RepID=A0AAN8JEP8_PATCE